MTEKETIDFLRSALACIWTEIDYKEDPDIIWRVQKISAEALDLTQGPPRFGKCLTGPGTSTNGVEAWEEYKAWWDERSRQESSPRRNPS